ncbi:CLUMA_CG012577, isoform A [Clunio marinus]|uniref:CLUMA_CG012577, isoform A n=1 Tax=Clunio marinus TaxID=568069 RepID=A0A1J1IGG7_9DIPT|nr:CLUMA_CG012577, isoform A [Clunio marinus]
MDTSNGDSSSVTGNFNSPNRNSHSSPADSPQTDINHTDTSVEMNGLKGSSSSQQFCLRWNNHQTSLLSTLPQLLDQSHLSDCTIVADGRKIRAHRLVLSGCSTFFSELFHTLESGIQQQSCHPVIVLPPNTNFSSLAALITFMYSGEVNVYEDQISKLLELAETLGIKGLTEINNEHVVCNNGIKTKKQPSENQIPPSATPPADEQEKRSTSDTPKPQQQLSPSPFDTSQLTTKLLTPPASFDAFFSRPHPSQFNFYPHHLLTQPLNFSTNRLPFPSMLAQMPQIPPQSPQFNKNSNGTSNTQQDTSRNFIDELYKKDRLMQQDKRMKPTNLKKIDKIAENLRFGANSTSPPSSASPSSTKSFLDHFSQMSVVKKESSPLTSYPMSPTTLQSASAFLNDKNAIKPTGMENLLNFQNDSSKKTTAPGGTVATTNSGPTTKIPNSKLFAKCFICSKLLSNQYNLRVHLETHQNMRYACTVCSHVSRSKDALRKHISYRHPGTPSPCESENRRKRTKLASQIQQIQAQQIMKDQIAAGNMLFPPNTTPSNQSALQMNMDANASQLALLQSFTSEMTIPTQTQLYHHQQQQNQPSQQVAALTHPNVKNEINNNGDEHMASGSQ